MCEACLFCIYPLSAAVCTVLFPEHRNTADALMARPLSNPSARAEGAPCSLFQGDPPSFEIRTVRSGLCTCLGFGPESNTGCNLDYHRVMCSADRIQPATHFSYLPRRTVNVVPFRELAMVALPEGVLQGQVQFLKPYNPLLCFRLQSGITNKRSPPDTTLENLICYFCHLRRQLPGGKNKVADFHLSPCLAPFCVFLVSCHRGS